MAMIDYSALCSQMSEMVAGALGDNFEHHKLVIAELNDYIKNRKWLETKASVGILENSSIYETDKMAELVKLINFGKKEWEILKLAKTKRIHPILCIVNIITYRGDKDTIMTKVIRHDGVSILMKLYQVISCSYQMGMVLLILNDLLDRLNDASMVKDLLPMFPRVVHNIKQKELAANWRVTFGSIELLHSIVRSANNDEVQQLLHHNIVSIFACAFKTIPTLTDCTPLQIDSMWDQMIMTMVNINERFGRPDDMLPAIPGLLKAIENKKFVDLEPCLCGAHLLIDSIVKNGKQKHIESLLKANVIQSIVNSVKVLQVDMTPGSLYMGTIKATVVWIITVAAKVDTPLTNRINAIVPLVPRVVSYVLTNPDSHEMSHLAITLFNCMATAGKKEDLKAMLKHDVVTTILKVFEAHHGHALKVDVISILYEMVMKVGRNKYLSQELPPYIPLFFSYFKRWETLEKDQYVLIRPAYIAVAMADIIKDNDHTKGLTDAILENMVPFFHALYKTVRSDTNKVKTDITVGVPTFMINTMINHKMLQPIVVHQIWFILEHGSEWQIVELFLAMPRSDTKDEAKDKVGKTCIEDKRDEVLNFVMSKAKDIIEQQDGLNSKLELTQITQFLIEVSSCDAHDDQTIFWLEDMVSPCLGVLQNCEDKTIINNVKQFINLLHH